MATLRRAWWLSKMELKLSVKNYLTIILLAVIYTFFLRVTIADYLESSFFLVDVLLIFYLVTTPFSTKPKALQYQKVNDGLFATPYFSMLYQLPIKRAAIITSRFIVLYVAIIVSTTFLFTMTYLTSSVLRETIAIPQFLALMLIWICISMAIGGLFPASDPGDKIKRFTMFWSYMTIIIFFVALYIIFPLWFDTGLLNWTIYLANEHTIISIFAFLTLAGLCTWQWFRVALKRLKTIDYLD
ncbi:hypothetical protein FLK61_24110 [Paenalkalicoccus suaedae]|uniref:ABC-2 transporter permease n=1 Tax=Paenalkalicoccus suaedae TaxID=2592382 RepID=A0A859FBF8_9BACI|nr:hypothetical protein [Paenalkalicoccus suaedae]QKS69874.1 hypothetical protein FLK61_24110 [Paenalkalicoccus suaedae]